MKFIKSLTIEINHAYYDGRPCNDLLIEPTPECAGLLKKYAMVFNNTRSGNVSVLSQSPENEIVASKNKVDQLFEFLVFFRDVSFISYTKLPFKDADQLYCFTNIAEDKKASSNLIASVISKSEIKSGAMKNLFGMIRIHWRTSFPEPVHLNFDAADVNWKYYLVVNNNFKNLIVDGTLANIKFIKSKADKKSTDKIFDAMNNNFPGANLLVFQSEAAIPYRQQGRKNIQLINSDNNNVLINHLPNPGLKENGIKIINTLN